MVVQNSDGLSMADVLTLPELQRQIALSIQRNQGCTLSELLGYLNLAEESVSSELNILVEEGYISESKVAGSSRYYITLARRGEIRGSQTSHQSLTPGKPLSTIINPSGEFAVTPGSSLELCVTVTNEGDQSALIDIFIDETSEPLHGWCLSPRERLALGRGQSGEVIFQIQIPLDALPGTYNYLLLVDAQQHYPEDTPIQHQSRFRVLPFVQEAVKVNDPTFTLVPVTSSTNPHSLQPGTSFPIQVFVHNRSNRVDRFRLTCPDLEPKWFTVIYPEGLPELGVVRDTDALELNPGDKGQIQLILTPPPDAVAAVYSPTIRLYSLDNPDLVLLEPVYFQIEPIYLLNVELVTLVGKINNRAGLFELQLYNGGNCPREIVLEAKSVDGDDLCTYTLTPEKVRLLPKSYGVSTLQIEATSKWWKRPFYGRVFNFIVEIRDTQQLPLTNNRYQGTLIWEGRPWWHFLLVMLGIVGLIGALILLIWWSFFRPKPLPQIVDFAPASSTYSEAEGDVVRLNWKIANPKRLQSLKLEGLSPDGMVITSPILYDFSKGLPNELKSFCVQQVVLICKNVPTDARRSGNYIFQLTLVPLGKKGVASETVKTSTIQIAPFPLPKILEFASPLPVYQEAINETAGPTTSQTDKTATTQNQTANQTPTQTLTQALTQTLSPNQNPNQTKTPTPNPTPSPTPTQSPTPNPTPSPNKVIKVDRILLNWKISHPEEIKTLKLIGRDAEGVVNVPEISFDFSMGVPQVLWKFCQLTEEGLLCRNLPTNATKAGTYIFDLTIITKHGNTEVLETKKTDPIKIEAVPVPIEILEFKLNNVDPLPKYRIPIDPKQPIVLLISWKVKGDKDTKVEILPAPGTVPLDGKIPYPLSQEGGTETITLQVTNKAGEQKSRSVSIETFIPPPPPIPSPAPSANASPPGSGKAPGGAPGTVPVLPALPGSAPPSGTVPVPLPPPVAATPEASPGGANPPGGASPPGGGAAPSPSGPSPLPPPPGGTPPLPPGNDSPPPAELPPQF